MLRLLMLRALGTLVYLLLFPFARLLEYFASRLYRLYARRISALVGCDRYPNISIEVYPGLPGGAAGLTSGHLIKLSAIHFIVYPMDAGCILHEFTHAIMDCPRYDDQTRWLIEGIADYVRDTLGFETSWSKAHYEEGKTLDGYQTTAHFLVWLERHYPDTVRRLSRRLSDGTYTDEDFLRLCGMELTELVYLYEREHNNSP